MHHKILNPREAIVLARSLGWTVEAKRGTGELRYRAPDGRRFTSQAPGRTHQVPAKLAIALQRAAVAS